MGQCPDSIKRLIDRFTQQSDQLHSPDYNETLIRVDFLNPLMSELGWDIDNHQGFAERYREVVHEDHVRVAGQTKAPDYSFRVGGQRKFFLEAKKPAVDIKNNWEPYRQLDPHFIHEFIDHTEGYVRGAVHTNGIQNFRALFKRCIKGTHVSIEPFHLAAYVDSEAFRFNHRLN